MTAIDTASRPAAGGRTETSNLPLAVGASLGMPLSPRPDDRPAEMGSRVPATTLPRDRE
jgi:hypothetical protein